MTTARLHVSTNGRRLLVRWSCPDVATWQAVLTDFKACFSRHHERTYLPTERAWSLPLRCRRRLMEWAASWFDADAQRWDEEEPEPATSGGPPPGTRGAPVSELEAAYKVLHLYPTAPPELVQAAHRILVKKGHPDKGGSHEEAVQINRAWEVIERERARTKMGRSA